MQQILKFSIAAWLFVGLLSGCNRETIMPVPDRPERGESIEDLLRDSVYMYTYYFYLWQDQLPDQFPTRSYASAEQVLEALKGYAKDPEGEPYDRFSFLDRSGTVNAEIQQGIAGSFGFDVRYNNDTDLYVKKVDGGSPADNADIKRGWQILEVNGNRNLAAASMEQDNFTFLFNALDGQAISLRLRKPNGDEVSLTLNRGNYQIQPILADAIYTVAGKKVGYFAFDSFVSTMNNSGGPTYVRNQLDQLVSQLEEEGVSELIVDLRYNGGGAVITAEYLSNMLAPTSVGSGLMYTSKINEILIEDGWDEDVFPSVDFAKTNALNLDRIFFLVTGGTASASELLINNLVPHTDVKLIGEHATYGKPVGYFGWDILGVDLYAVSFQTLNSQGFGDYFSGMPVDKLVFDDLTKDFGDRDEGMIAEALHYVQSGNFSADPVNLQSNMRAKRVGKVATYNKGLDKRGNKGMYNFGKNTPLYMK